MGTLHMLSVVGKTSIVRIKAKIDNELMYVKLHINSKSANAMMDSRVTRNIIDVPGT